MKAFCLQAGLKRVMHDSMLQHVVIFMGPPGSGKGTVSKRLVDELGWVQLSTGNLCRKHIAQQTQIGKAIDLLMNSGKLVDDELISAMTEEWLAEQSKTSAVLLDGFPRTARQAALFLDILTRIPVEKLDVVNFIVPDEVIIERLANRKVCSNKDCQAVFTKNAAASSELQAKGRCSMCGSPLIERKDDAPEAVRERLRVYHQHEAALMDCLKAANIQVHQIDGNRVPADVYQDVLNTLATHSV